GRGSVLPKCRPLPAPTRLEHADKSLAHAEKQGLSAPSDRCAQNRPPGACCPEKTGGKVCLAGKKTPAAEEDAFCASAGKAGKSLKSHPALRREAFFTYLMGLAPVFSCSFSTLR